jgi:hypothetical protein
MLFFGACFTENNVLRLGEQRRGENRTETNARRPAREREIP